MLPNYAKWCGFAPPHWPNFPPPLTNKLMEHIAPSGQGHLPYRCPADVCHLKGKLTGGSHRGCDY